MPPFDSFAHYLAYGATDQQTFVELRESYDGVLVPGTIAAFQRQGTGGFVLSLSATPESPPYMIDPRFPLFQQGLSNPKQSHLALAKLLGDPNLIQPREPSAALFPDPRLAELAKRWARFNTEYGVTSNEKFDKYAKRLGEPVAPEAARGPEAVLAPYFAANGVRDPWWDRSKQLFDYSRAECTDRPCYRVVCAPYTGVLGELLGDVGSDEQLVVWVSDLDEHSASTGELIEYHAALAEAEGRGQQPFALYGGFFSVLLGAAGLCGAAHGVGFSEHRNWRELPESGAPPARYYMRRAHRYVAQPLAQELWNVDPDLVRCPCAFCNGRPPVALDYHDLMKHSVCCRAEEIDRWFGLDPATAAELLDVEHEGLTQEIRDGGLAPAIRARAIAAVDHMLRWVAALEQM